MSLTLLNCVSCSSGSSGPPPPPPINCIEGTGGNVTISGKATFDLVPFSTSGTGLDYAATNSLEPIKEAVVELVCGAVIATTNTDPDGNYSLTAPSGSTDLFVRVKAQMKKTGIPSWDFTVVDNTRSKALYAMDSSLFDANSDLNLNLHADSGWGTTSYTGTRVAGPFAILDSVYHAYNKVLTADSAAVFPPLKLNWSVNNVLSEKFIPTIGQIKTSLFDGTEIYILGKENSDTDEYDDHVIIHEWGHYFEEFFSRSDSIGGPHGTGDVLDIRVAFSEGWGNAWSGIVTNNPLYKDSFGPQQNIILRVDVDDNNCTNPGWFSECSVQAIIYDLYDAYNSLDTNDNVELGFAPIYDVLTTEQRNTPALTSIFSFISALNIHTDASSSVSDIEGLVTDQGINAVNINIYGDNEVNEPPNPYPAVLPVYSDIVVNAPVITVCGTTAMQTYNGLGTRKFLRFSLVSPSGIEVKAIRNPLNGTGDPDIYLFKIGQIDSAESWIADVEALNTSLDSGDYIIELYDWNVPADSTSCYDIYVNAI